MSPTSSLPASKCEKLREFSKARFSKLVDAWFAIQLAHFGGKYSIERMLALEEYSRETSLTRVLFITIGAPLVVVSVVLLQESIPLQDPAAGWKANYGFWIRVGMFGVAVGIASTIHLRLWIGIHKISTLRTLFYCLVTGGVYISTGIAAASVWVFPIPFHIFTLGGVTLPLVLAYIRIVMGSRALWELFDQPEQLRRMKQISVLQAFLYVAYPLYQVLFTTTNHTYYELPVLLLLPVFRLVIKKVFAMAASHKEDIIPVHAVFTVDFFDALYMATFMQSLSITTLLVVVAVDIVQTAMELQELYQRTIRIIARTQKVVGPTTNNSYNSNLLEAVRSLCSSSAVLQKQIRAGISVRSCIEHGISPESNNLLTILENAHQTGSSARLFDRLPSIVRLPSQSATIGPTPADLVTPKSRPAHRNNAVQPCPPLMASPENPRTEDLHDRRASNYSSRRRSVVDSSVVLKDALEVLFTSECLLLTEYVEVIIPVLYGAFILTMTHQSSAQYHTEMKEVTLENVKGMVFRMLLYALLELASFAVLALITKRNCGINALYQLAFVLEKQMAFIQVTLLMGVLMTLIFRVEHFGVDFSFQFEWITHN